MATIKAYSKTEIARLYNITYHVLRVWLLPFTEKIGECKARTYTPAQVQIIFECLGEP